MGDWIFGYLGQAAGMAPVRPGRKRPLVLLALADHFEPFWRRPGRSLALARVEAWERGWPDFCEGLGDAKGRPPQHTFFYPADEYDAEVLDRLAALCARGFGDVEVHLHHQGETPAELEDKLASYAELLHERHGLLHKNASGKITYGFIHGNWALDNSLPDGSWCGVNGELSILARTGCYADFTLPSAPSPAQTRIINSIYYADGDPARPKSHNTGRLARVGVPPRGELLLIQGVLGLNWRLRKKMILPSLENSDLGFHRPYRLERVPVWLKYAPRVQGAEDVRFLKLSCHGAPEMHHRALLGAEAREFFKTITGAGGADPGFDLHFVTCREMARAVHALEKGEWRP